MTGPSVQSSEPSPATIKQFATALGGLYSAGRFEANGLSFSEDQITEIENAISEFKNAIVFVVTDCAFDGDLTLTDCRVAQGSTFAGAKFNGALDFTNSTTSGLCTFRRAVFFDSAKFASSTFHGDLDFTEAKFHGHCDFTECMFKANPTFRKAQFYGPTSFNKSTFEMPADFMRASFLVNDPDAVTPSFLHARFDMGVSFDSAIFGATADFRTVKFGEISDFFEAKFDQGGHFHSARFEDDITFENCDASGKMQFNNVGFDGRAMFSGASLGDIDFSRATFANEGEFDGSKFASADFEEAQFNSSPYAARFEMAMFTGRATFERAAFHGNVSFFGANFQDSLDCTVVKFANESNFRVRSLGVEANFGEARFFERVEFENAQSFFAIDARFDRGFRLGANGGDIILRNVQIGGPSLIEPEKQGDDFTPPRVVDLRKTNVETLAIAGAGLGECKFENAHRLDELVVEGSITFSNSPGFRIKPWSTTTKRKVIAEEREWWVGRGVKSWANSETPKVEREKLEVERGRALGVAASYRALRRGLEKRRETELAGDFYYGEMQMRRKGSDGFWLRQLLAGYWALSGYGTRASRSLVWLLATMAGFTALFNQLNVVGDKSTGLPLNKAITLTFGSSVNFLKAPPDSYGLNTNGEMLTIVLHLVAVLLVALFVLALRQRVKR